MSGASAEGEDRTKEMTALPGIVLPPSERLTDGERHRRQALYEQTRSLREEIGPIDIPTYELVREGRDE